MLFHVYFEMSLVTMYVTVYTLDDVLPIFQLAMLAGLSYSGVTRNLMLTVN